MWTVVLWITLICSDTLAQIMLKLGAMKAASSEWAPNAFILCAYGCYIISFLVWMQILKRVRLFIALSAATVVYATIALSAHFLFKEKITNQVIVGTIFIATGLFMLGWKKRGSKDEAAM
jgi:drug/metabolite transporter (DMT)-like permease